MQEKPSLKPEIHDGSKNEWAHFLLGDEVFVVFESKTSFTGWKTYRIPRANAKSITGLDVKTWGEIKGAPLAKVFGTEAALADFATLLPVSHSVTHKILTQPAEILVSLKDGKVRANFKKSSDSSSTAPVAEQATEASPVASARAPGSKTKVLIVDDSKTIRTILQKVFATDPSLEVIGALENPLEVEAFIAKNRPDVITLDIHMPGLNGVELLKRYLPKYAIPTIMISSISLEEGPLVLAALEAGAVDYLQKPSFEELKAMTPVLLEKIKSAAVSRVRIQSSSQTSSLVKRAPTVSGGVVTFRSNDQLIVIGSSTGGTEALRHILTALPAQIPPILIVQHIPAVFSRSFAERMDSLCPFEVLEAKDGDECIPNRVLIAPGGTQMSFESKGAHWKVRVDENADKVNRHRPSVDYLFRTIPAALAPKTVGVILTGMGADGAQGLLDLKNAGCQTLGQDEQSCVVYGMPQAAFKLGAVLEQVSLDQMASAIMRNLARKKKAA